MIRFPAGAETRGSSPYSQQPVIGPCLSRFNTVYTKTPSKETKKFPSCLVGKKKNPNSWWDTLSARKFLDSSFLLQAEWTPGLLYANRGIGSLENFQKPHRKSSSEPPVLLRSAPTLLFVTNPSVMPRNLHGDWTSWSFLEQRAALGDLQYPKHRIL
jgi:hypothetical protein